VGWGCGVGGGWVLWGGGGEGERVCVCVCLIVCCIETAKMKLTWPNFESCETKNGYIFAVYGDK